MELTQEHFDKQLENLQTNITGKIDRQTVELKQYVHESFETQQVYIEERFKEVLDTIDVRERVEKHEVELQRIKQQLKLT